MQKNAHIQTVILAVFLMVFAVSAASADDVRGAKILDLRGKVEVRTGGGSWQPATKDMQLYEKDEVRTGDDGFVSLELDKTGETGTFELPAKSHLRLSTLKRDKATGDKTTYLDLALGKVLVHAEKLEGASKFEVKTPNASAGVRGTVFEVSVDEGEL